MPEHQPLAVGMGHERHARLLDARGKMGQGCPAEIIRRPAQPVYGFSNAFGQYHNDPPREVPSPPALRGM